jgi:predicted peptidase
MAQQVRTFEVGTLALRHLLHLPPGYGSEDGKRWPLIVFLHGAGERGSDIEQLKQHGIPRVAEENADFPFIAVSPQCPTGTWWSFELEPLAALVKHLLSAYDVDPDRVYLTGISMGGYGAWNLAVAQPELFAALAPVCGGGDPDTVCAIKQVPVWAFHGALDNVVLLRESRKMVDALRACGGRVRFTIYPNAGHDSWTRTYNNPRLYEWLLSHYRGEPVELPPA